MQAWLIYIIIAMAVSVVYIREIGMNSVFMANMCMLELTINIVSFIVVSIHMKEIDERVTIV